MENQEIMEQFSENRQNYMMDNNSMQHMNINVTSAVCGDSVVGGGVQADMVSGVVGGVAGESLGVKYDEQRNEEHDVGDDDELKYVKEVQQSEKQQQQQSFKNFDFEEDGDKAKYEQNELAEKEITNAATYHFGNGDANFVFGENHHQEQLQHQQQHDLFSIGNGHNTNGHDEFANSHGFEDKINFETNDMDGFKHDTDFSSSTNVTESADCFVVPQVDVKIETKPELQPEMQDEEEPSSLATNTTNGTSSLSENVPAPKVACDEPQQHQANAFDDFMSNLENKENTDPLMQQRPAELDLDLGHSQLNPDAKEFIPSFGSNPASPTSPFSTGEQQNDGVILSETMETQMYFGQAPSAVPRNLLNDDEIVAQSPRKGKGDNDLDAVPLPDALSEFEEEADKRPHELEIDQRDDVMTPDQAIQQLPLDDLVLNAEPESYCKTDSTEFSQYGFKDHGPETSVDNDVDMQPAEVFNPLTGEYDVMKTSIYLASNEAIEDVLNSVQPLPSDIDSVNNSFIDESATESAANQLMANDKELLQVEEKEHVSHSASLEEMQINLLNTLNSSNKDISQLPNDMENANNMQQSIYMENEELQKQEVVQDQEDLLVEKSNEDQFLHQQLEFQSEKDVEQEDMGGVEDTLPTQQLDEQMQLSTEEILIEKQEDLTQKQEDLMEKQEDLIEKHEDLLEKQEDLTEKQEDLAEKHEDLLEKHEDLLEKQEDIAEKQEDLAEKHEDLLEKQEDLLEKHEVVAEKQEDLTEHQQIPLAQTQQEELCLDEPQNQLENDTQQEFTIEEEKLLADTTIPLDSNETFLDNTFVSHEQQQEIMESNSPFKITDEITTSIPTLDNSLNIETTDNQQQNLSDVLSPSSTTADEKHLLEETKEQHQQLSVSVLEQQMNEMTLSNNNDGNLSQADEIEATPAANTIEDISENLISPDEAANVTHEQLHQDQHEDMLVNDEPMDIENPPHESVPEQHIEEPAPVNESEVIEESIESPIQLEEQQELEESNLVAVEEEPIVEAKQAAQLFTTNQETENESKIEEQNEEKVEEKPIELQQQQQELPPSMVPETAPAELLEPPKELNQVTEQQEEQPNEIKPIEEVISEPIKEPVVVEDTKPNEEASVKPDIPIEAAIVAATAAVAATTVAGAKVVASPSKKAETAKKPLAAKTSATAAKPKVGATQASKKPVAGSTSKPRTTAAPAKTATTTTSAAADKKPLTKPTTSTATTARKPLSATGSTASKVAAKTSSTTSSTRTAATAKPSITSRPATAPRTVTSTTTARKPTTTATTNGQSAKPRPASAPTKPNTLGLSTTNGALKTKPASPRATLTSQVRKTASATTAAKSPVKSTMSSTLASKTKTTTTSTSSNTVSATGTKTFTARPAPKFNHNSSSTATTTTTTRRLTVAGTTATSSTTTTTTAKTSSTPLRKSSPTKTTTGKTPTKSTSTVGALKSKTPVSKTASSPSAKPAPIRKPADKTINVSNSETIDTVNKNLETVQQQQLNGDTSIPMPNDEPSRDEQISMDAINA